MMAFFEGVTSICCALVMYRSLKSVLKSWLVASKSKSACSQTVLLLIMRTVDGAYLAWNMRRLCCCTLALPAGLLAEPEYAAPRGCVKDMQALQCVSLFMRTAVRAAPKVRVICLLLAVFGLSCEQHLCNLLLKAVRLLTLFLRYLLPSCEHPCSALARTSTTCSIDAYITDCWQTCWLPR